MNYNLIAVIGPTATGKTTLACQLAKILNGEVVSADSRQVYRNLDIGTGKDLDEYEFDGCRIPYHLIDIAPIGYEYNVFQFQQDAFQTIREIHKKDKMPVLCGGSGMYIEAIVKKYDLKKVPVNQELRDQLSGKSHQELVRYLSEIRQLHNVTDIIEKDRLIRAIEIATFQKEHDQVTGNFPEINPIVFGIHFNREKIKKRITERLRKRLSQGMIDEVENLLNAGITPEQLKFYGLEYRFLTQYLLGEINYNDMFQKLNAAIHGFAKRQMTWFRKMEREGIDIKWIDGNLPLNKKLDFMLQNIKK